ncbi:S41 family peptidase [Mobilitalea sibirica]|uniref:S41 family peptidase n=1 Tax=Mobilitalea sibirica TaxID=1462919 RepID=A0A8J7HDT0_9FIRM|nr:S41 family peptidase [Mobilitalea sibirica]MBH1942457.1 S41 family peptidase [Mobilitalea sibirica]
MKKNFRTGVLSGLFGAILLFAVTLTVYALVDGKALDDGTKNQYEATNDGNDSYGTEKQSQDEGVEQDNIETQSIKDEKSYDKIIEKLELLEMIVDNYYLENVDDKVFEDGIYKGFMSSLEDPYSTYFTKDEYKALVESSSGIYHGIGATVSQDVKTGIITIVKPFAGGPAFKAGLLPGDIIFKVEEEEVTGLDLSEVVSRMKGKEGTEVHISIMREGEVEPLEFTITRREIKVPTIEYQMLKDKIGYIVISEFDEITISQFKNAMTKLEEDGMKGLVVDVRNNPGGLLHSVVRILDRLLPKGLIVYTEDKYGNRLEEKAIDSKRCNLPIAVLINGNSASASEIFAGALQDYEAATVVGTTSFGKGIVQKVIPLTDGTAVKLTISKYFTPKGRNIHGTGIAPDIEVELAEELRQKVTIELEEDNQLQEAIKVVKDKIK